MIPGTGDNPKQNWLGSGTRVRRSEALSITESDPLYSRNAAIMSYAD